MPPRPNLPLVLAFALTELAALAHFACIPLGGPAFRWLGAGEQMARMAEDGHWYPALVAFVIGSALSVCALFALSASGLRTRLPRLPLLRPVLAVAAGVFLLRALAFPLLKPAFPDNSDTFWLVTSGVCLVLGSLYLLGLLQTRQPCAA